MEIEQLLEDRVLVREVLPESETESGIVIPDQAKERNLYGEVVQCGPGRYDHGEFVEVSVEEGDMVCYPEYAGIPFPPLGEGYWILRSEEIIAVVSGG